MHNLESPEIDFRQENAEMNPEIDIQRNKILGMGDFPSLKDLETSNAFTKSNINITENKAKLVE